MNTTTDFRTWTASRTGEVRHYFNGSVAALLGIKTEGFDLTVNGESANSTDRRRILSALRTVSAWVDANGEAHVTGWDGRVSILPASAVAAAVVAAYAA